MDFNKKSKRVAVKKRFFKVTTFFTAILLLQFVKLGNVPTLKDLKVKQKSFEALQIPLTNAVNQSLSQPEQLVNLNDSTNLNNTQKAQMDMLVFNRVPKAGSTMLMVLLKHLGRKNRFASNLYQKSDREGLTLSNHKQQKLSGIMTHLPRPGNYIRHFPYIDFEKYNYPKPIYINMVRDPVERVISGFYHQHNRAIKKHKKQHPNEPDPDWIRKDFASCVLTHDPECHFNNGSHHHGLILYFCGNEPDCLNLNSQESFDRAKINLENEYAVVGVLEELDKTLAVFEKFIPRFFDGAAKLYDHLERNLRKINSNKRKPKVDDEIKDLVRKNLTLENKFYELCKERLNSQFLAIIK